MQIGYNNDVEYRGKTFHIQTEDRGMDASQIETQIFHAGAILDTAIIPYERHVENVEGDELVAKIRQIMQAAHKNFYKKLHAGDYDEMVGLESLDTDEPPDLPEPEEFEPGQDRVPASAMEMEENPEAFAIEEEMGEAVSLQEIQAKLKADQAALDAREANQEEAKQAEQVEQIDESSVAEADSPTMMVSAAELSNKIEADARSRRASPPHLEWPKTGATAWTGCKEPREDLSLVGMVEEALG